MRKNLDQRLAEMRERMRKERRLHQALTPERKQYSEQSIKDTESLFTHACWLETKGPRATRIPPMAPYVLTPDRLRTRSATGVTQFGSFRTVSLSFDLRKVRQLEVQAHIEPTPLPVMGHQAVMEQQVEMVGA